MVVFLLNWGKAEEKEGKFKKPGKTKPRKWNLGKLGNFLNGF
jgi:hypothetical protein